MPPQRILVVSALCLALAACTTQTAPPTDPKGAQPDYSTWGAGVSQPIVDPVYPEYGNAGVDVLHYGLELSWTPETDTLHGIATIRLRVTTDLNELRLDFSSALSVDSVTLDNAIESGSHRADKLSVVAERAKDSHSTLVVKYHGTPKPVRAPTKRTDFEALGMRVTDRHSLWTMQEPFGAFTWYPVNEHPSDKALYDIQITVPDGWSGVASGTPAGQEGNTYRYTSSDPAASYLTTLAVDRFARETATGPGGLPLTYWFDPSADALVKDVVRGSPRLLAWLEQRFGRYPFPTAGTVTVPSPSGMETQQMVTLGSAVRRDRPKESIAAAVESVLFHEYAHHWFGDTVTTSNWSDLWLNEGWATYVQALFESERDLYSLDEWEFRARIQDGELRKKFGPPGKPRKDEFGSHASYVPPALMLRQIHKQVGDKAFFALAKDWVQNHRNTVQDRASLIAFVNEHTGRDFTKTVNTWLDSAVTPK
ncbi:M1 family metallopeptidase [Catellatospora aurea]|uniref:Aminopeptidase N n=1 Tax=Catellatospora aurea TaxID=1337874 RepID=A0ABW2H5H4_9ACTN